MKTLNPIKFSLVATAMFLLAGCASVSDSGTGSTAAQNSNQLIVPDERIGSFQLGMSDKDLFKLGVPYQAKPFNQWTVYFYTGIKIFVDNNTHNVVFVEVHGDKSYHTSDGLRIGSQLVDVEKAMGPPDSIQGNSFFGNAPVNLKYKSGNLEFGFGRYGGSMADSPGNSVTSISIQTPGTGLF